MVRFYGWHVPHNCNRAQIRRHKFLDTWSENSVALNTDMDVIWIYCVRIQLHGSELPAYSEQNKRGYVIKFGVWKCCFSMNPV